MFDRALTMSLEGAVLRLSGSVDEYAVADLRTRLADLGDAVPDLVVNLTAVDFLPSAGIGVLVRDRATRRARGRTLTLVAADQCPAARTLSLTGLPFEPDVSPGTSGSSVG